MLNLCDSISDDKIKWEPFSNETLCSRFSFDSWHKMVADIDNDKDWAQFLGEYSDLVRCYVLYCKLDNEPIAFAYILQEDEDGKIVSFHGGGWCRSVKHTMLYYRGMIRLVESLLERGLKVRTACKLDNIIAYRFIKSAGFVNYRNGEKYHHFWANEKRLYNSKIYRYLNLND